MCQETAFTRAFEKKTHDINMELSVAVARAMDGNLDGCDKALDHTSFLFLELREILAEAAARADTVGEFELVCPHCGGAQFQSFIVRDESQGDYVGMLGREMKQRCLDCGKTFSRPAKRRADDDAGQEGE